jgi:hypothetical protein
MVEREMVARLHLTPTRAACPICGFCAPARTEVPAALEVLPRAWAQALADRDPPDPRGAARLAAELQIVGECASRILAEPSPTVPAPLPPGREEPRQWPGEGSRPAVLLLLAAQRVLDLVHTMGDDDWDRTGQAGDVVVRLEDLLAVPLHRSHARLEGAAPCW